jgi:hypothetical protein
MVELTVGKIDPKDTYRVRVVKYLSDRTLKDEALEDACKKENKTLDGVMNYIIQEAKKVAVSCNGGKGAWVDDEEVWNWAVHYILEDSIDCEPKKEEPKPVSSAASFYEQWKKDHPTPPATPKGKSVIEHSGQLVFDF